MSQITEFAVRAAAYERDAELDTEYLVLAENPDGSGQRLEIQRGLSEPTEDDRELGQDTYCLVDESGATHYGGVLGWHLRDDQVRIDLDAEAAEVLRTEGFALRLVGAGAPAGAVQAGLDAILGGG